MSRLTRTWTRKKRSSKSDSIERRRRRRNVALIHCPQIYSHTKHKKQIDALDRLIVSSLKQSTKTKREQSDQAWKLHDLIQGSIDRSNDVLKIYRDESGFRKEEIEQMSNENAVDSFYDRLREIKQFNRVNSR